MTLQEEQLRQAIRELVPNEKDREILWRGIEEYALLVSSGRDTEVREMVEKAEKTMIDVIRSTGVEFDPFQEKELKRRFNTALRSSGAEKEQKDLTS